MRHLIILSGILACCGFADTGFSQASSLNKGGADLSKQIVGLRTEIDGMTGQLQTLREEHRAQVTAFSSRKADLEITIERDQSLLAQLRKKIAEAKTSNSSLKDNSEKVLPEFLKLCTELKNYIESSLPYSRKERLESVTMLVDQVKGGELNVFKAMGRLWALIEDQFRVANEINISKQIIALNGQEILSDVVKIGSVTMFYLSNDGKFGYASHKSSGSWNFVELEGKDNKRMISNLFDSLKKQVRVGLFELPMVFPDLNLVTNQKRGG